MWLVRVEGAHGSKGVFSLGDQPGIPEHRFSSPVFGALETAGWHSGRRVDISGIADALTRAGHVLHERFMLFATEFAGLRVEPVLVEGPNFANDEPLWINPKHGVRYLDEVRTLREITGEDWNPVGWWLSNSHVFMGTSGRMLAHLDGLVWELGRTPWEGVEFAVMPTRPLVCLWSAPGRRPWPHPFEERGPRDT